MSNYDKYKTHYFTIVAHEDGLNVTMTRADANNGTSFNVGEYCKYRIDDGEWYTWHPNYFTETINKDHTLSFSCKLLPIDNNGQINIDGIGTFVISKNFSIRGNILSLIDGDNFETAYPEYIRFAGYTFAYLFYNCQTLIDASGLVLQSTNLENSTNDYDHMFYNCKNLKYPPEKLPATHLGKYSYTGMFGNCTSLITAPEISATLLNQYCCEDMFNGCTSLTTAPELPATNLSERCYSYMFYGCTSLTTAPDLPATILGDAVSLTGEYATECYSHMFRGCTSLTKAPDLPATILAIGCYSHMFYGCTSLTTAPELPAMTLKAACYEYMFYGCTSLTKAPLLLAPTLAGTCYSHMFQGCSNLNSIKMLGSLPSGISSWSNPCGYWTDGVKNVSNDKGTFTRKEGVTITNGVNGIPTLWYVINDNYKIATKAYINSNIMKGSWFEGDVTTQNTTDASGNTVSGLKKCVVYNDFRYSDTGSPVAPDLISISGTINNTQCIRQNRFSINPDAELNIYWGIWNDKSSNAKLDWVEVQISTSSDTSSGTWYGFDAANVNPGEVNTTKTGYNTITINKLESGAPNLVNTLKNTQYYIRVKCGVTNNNQTWYAAWGNRDRLSNVSWGSSSNTNQKATSAIPLQCMSLGGNCVLKTCTQTGGTHGRTTTNAACFKIK